MEKKVIKKILALLMIITILSTDFWVLGSSLITYAANQIESVTDEPNITFSAYFKNEKNEKVSNISQSIKNEDLKLYAEIQIQKEGYFKNGTIEIQNTNFNVKNDILSPEILKIEGNKIKLKQINAGETVEIAIGIEPIITNKVPANMQLEESVKLTGKYVSSENEEGEEIVPVNRNLSMNYKVDETAKAEIETEIITNKVYTVNETTETIVQLLVKSRLSENQYPVKETVIEVNIPEIDGKTPKAKAIEANGRTEIKDCIATKEGIIKTTLSNEPDEQNKVEWYRNGYDEIIVTYIYEGTVDTSNINLTANSEIKVYNAENTYKSESVSKTVSNEKDNRIIANQEINTVEMYKGPLYANTEMSYSTTTTLVVTNIKEEKEVLVKEGLDKFILVDETKVDTDSKYIKTEISKKQLLDILGTEGTITIKNGNKTLLETTRVSQVNEETIIVNYTNPVGELEIITSTPKAEGIVEIKHTKTMTANGYTRDQIRTIKELQTISFVQEISTVEKPTEARIEIKETISKADLIILSEGNLSTTEETNLKLGITLVANGAEYDLYKNPVIAIQMPAVVENVRFNTAPIVQNVNEKDTIIIGENNFRYDETTKQIRIQVTGEQRTYPEGTLSELYIPLDLEVKTSRLAATEKSTLKMMYINENAIQYYGGTTEVGVVEQEIGIQAPSGLIKYFNISSNDNKTLTENITQNIYTENAGKEVEFETAIVNNTESDITDVKVLGKLPTTGNDENTMETTLKSLTAPNATVYFTENTNATNDIEDATNGWTTNLSSLTNAKLYLIKIESLAKGSNYTAIAKIKLPNQIEKETKSNTQYEVTYNIDGQAKTENSRKILLKGVVELEVELIAQLGQEKLKTGDIVKEGEVIRYTAIVKNNSNKTFKNIQLKANVPEGTVVVEPVELYQYSVNPFYYEEKTDIKEISITIPTLASGETYTKQYEVRVNMNATTERTEISNEIMVTSNETQIKSEKITNSLKAADVRVTIRREDDQSATLVAGGNANYRVLVENFSDKEMNNIKIQLVSNEFVVTKIEKNTNVGGALVYAKSEMEVSQIQKQGNMCFIVNGNIVDDVEKLNINAKVTYSNEMYISNTITEDLPNIKTEIALTSPQNNQNIKQGENVTYNITVKNTGDTIKGRIMIKDIMPECLEIESIFVNGNVYIQKTNKEDKETYVESIMNEVEYYTNSETKTGDIIQITINAKVKEIPISADGTVIVNKAEVFAYEVYEGNSEEVKHILDCGQKNVVAGSIWLDDNADGIKDDKESTLSGVMVKLYDISIKSFVKDEDGNIVKTQTGTNGEYQFTQIPNGSYIIVFEHGMENYEPTSTQADFKAKLHEIILNGEKIIVSGIEIINMQDVIILNANIGLKEKEIQVPDDNNPDQPNDPIQPENPDQPNDPTQPENPDQPNKPTEPEKPNEVDKTKEISGYAWLDSDRDGEMDQNEKVLEGIKVKLYDISSQNYLKDEKGKVVKTSTDKYGKYKFEKIKEGLYIIIFEYDIEEYEPTTYLAEGVEEIKNSKVVLKKININGDEKVTAVTDTINLKEDISDINIGLREKLVFDLELSKSISRIVVQNNNGTKAYDYENKDFAKVEIHRKQINGSLVVLEYTIKVKNTGEAVGYAKNIVDYLPSGLTFSSELNKDWYLSGNYLYTKALENIELKPGEEKEVKLVLTKTMTNDNVGLINNRAEIYQDYNEYGIADIDSKPNNQIQDEDDLGSADVIILVATGGGPIISYMMLLMTNIILIGMAIKLMIRNKIIKIPNKRGRR